jgi:LmbE family N-acetylglucosaminyl deacetylase
MRPRQDEPQISTCTLRNIEVAGMPQNSGELHSNGVLVLIVDDSHLGTPARAWKLSSRIAGTAPLSVPVARRVVVVSPHPDDEVLGAGGLIQRFLAESVPLEFVAVTDGEASHPQSDSVKRMDLRSIRSEETTDALRRLGCPFPSVTRLGIPDGRVCDNTRRLYSALVDLFEPGDLCIAPWSLDGHPDHDACGATVDSVSKALGLRSLSYLVWAWHWADPEGEEIPWSACRRLDMTAHNTARKRWATRAFRSQTLPIGPDPEDAAVLPDHVVRRFWQGYEVFIDRCGETS